MLLTSIKLEDIDNIEKSCAILTEDGWVIPAWLVYLRDEVTKNELAKKAQNDIV